MSVTRSMAQFSSGGCTPRIPQNYSSSSLLVSTDLTPQRERVGLGDAALSLLLVLCLCVFLGVLMNGLWGVSVDISPVLIGASQPSPIVPKDCLVHTGITEK